MATEHPAPSTWDLPLERFPVPDPYFGGFSPQGRAGFPASLGFTSWTNHPPFALTTRKGMVLVQSPRTRSMVTCRCWGSPTSDWSPVMVYVPPPEPELHDLDPLLPIGGDVPLGGRPLLGPPGAPDPDQVAVGDPRHELLDGAGSALRQWYDPGHHSAGVPAARSEGRHGKKTQHAP